MHKSVQNNYSCQQNRKRKITRQRGRIMKLQADSQQRMEVSSLTWASAARQGRCAEECSTVALAVTYVTTGQANISTWAGPEWQHWTPAPKGLGSRQLGSAEQHRLPLFSHWQNKGSKPRTRVFGISFQKMTTWQIFHWSLFAFQIESLTPSCTIDSIIPNIFLALQ